LLLRADIIQQYIPTTWITTTLLVGNVIVTFSDPVLFFGLLVLACVRGGSNRDKPDEDAERKSASAECRVREDDRETLRERLRHEDSLKAIMTAASSIKNGGAHNCLELLYQPSQGATQLPAELVALNIASENDAATDDTTFEPLPMMFTTDTDAEDQPEEQKGPRGVFEQPMVSSTDTDADQPEEQQEACGWLGGWQ